MATIHVIWDPASKLHGPDPIMQAGLHLQIAKLDVAPSLSPQAIGATAGRLAQLLLEQVATEAKEG